MKLNVKIEHVNTLRHYFDEERKIGVEINVRTRKFYYLVDVETINGLFESNRVESFCIPKKFEKLLLRPKMDKAFSKIKHRYAEWGLPEVKFPWKTYVGRRV